MPQSISKRMWIDGAALRGKRILITRPREQAHRLCALIRRSGGRPLRFPLIAIEPLPLTPAARREAHEQLAAAATVIFISRNAARWFCREFPQAATVLAAKSILAAGPGTRDSLRRRGIEQAQCAAPGIGSESIGSEGLLALPQLAADAARGRRVLIVKGEGGRELLQQTLRRRGADIACLELYRRRPPQTSGAQFTTIWRQARPDAMIFTSAGGIANLARLIPPDGLPGLSTTPALVFGERVAAAARSAGFRRVLSAPAVGDCALLRALYQLYENQNR